MFFQYCSTFVLGCLVAIAELLSRYKNFSQIIKVFASWVYLAINGLASVLAYYLVLQFNIATGHSVFQIFIAGTSALAILRSSIANIKVGDKQADIGFSAILQVYLNAADRAFDQHRSDNELTEVEIIMEKVDFEKAKLALPTICFTIMKNVPQEEQLRVSTEVNKLSKGSLLDNKTKSLNLGIILSSMTGLKLLKKAVMVLEESISINGGPTPVERLDEILNKLKK
ncbi:MAG: hypothetical protein JWP78_2063 [Mucilaginibacter sp.]|nr:hypothetical protein [Mucilaginibacter sp.]